MCTKQTHTHKHITFACTGITAHPLQFHSVFNYLRTSNILKIASNFIIEEERKKKSPYRTLRQQKYENIKLSSAVLLREDSFSSFIQNTTLY
jgi:hypothetical protein